jgi:undecaprenyl diphosphate synthase
MGFFLRKKPAKDFGQTSVRHLAVIMDGNGRWAQRRGLPRNAGHKAGAEKVRSITEWCGNRGIKYLTVYAFSTENWSRPTEEVYALMELLIEFLNKYDAEMEKQGVRLRILGEIESLQPYIRTELENAEKRSINRSKMQLIIAFNYGGRREIVNALKGIAKKVLEKEIKPEDIDEAMVARHLYLPDIPEPDLIIRSSGELRLSNFLLWESAYTELWFSNILWPDFSEKDLDLALADFAARDRRFGGVKK